MFRLYWKFNFGSVFIFSCTLLIAIFAATPTMVLAQKADFVSMHVKKFEIEQVEKHELLQDIPLINSSKNSRDSIDNIASKYDITMIYVWEPDCGECLDYISDIDSSFRAVRAKGYDNINFITVTDYFTDRTKLRKKFFFKDFYNMDLIFVKDQKKYKHLASGKSSQLYLADGMGNIFARIGKDDYSLNALLYFIYKLSERIS